MINSGNTRREYTQALMIPELQARPASTSSPTTATPPAFQQRLPALDYDLAMYINTAQPGPDGHRHHVTATQSRRAENGNQGQNSTGWCNEEASALMTESDQTVDETERVDLIHQIGQYLADDAVMLPLYQFPNIAAWRTDKVGGPVDSGRRQLPGVPEHQRVGDPNGDGQIVIGAEQWPDCLNPITECANSSWYVWTTAFQVLPSVWDTTPTARTRPPQLVTGEPTSRLG